MAETSTTSKLTLLELVYTPMSNQEAVWFGRDPEVEAMLRTSDFYMIGGRAEAKFKNIIVDPDTSIITLDFVVEGRGSDPVAIHAGKLPPVAAANPEDLWIKAGEKIIHVGTGPMDGEGSVLLDWFTTEKLLSERSRGRAGIEGLDHFREFATYDLLYVGIAKVGDSFDRLIDKGHKARMDILANEPQRAPGARVTDETYLFLFSVNPQIMRTFEPDHEFTDEDISGSYDHKRIVADAEKAFVSLLKPGYNNIKFKNYPKGTDSLYRSGYVRYGYVLAENITFDTPHGRFRGGRDLLTSFISNEGDSIFVEGDEVTLLRSGIDYA